jgi:[protein-PII] uridylyltransferase
MSAVNPGFWTSWRAYLLKDLYLHTAEYLSGLREDRERHISSLLSLVSEKDVSALGSFIGEMPERYILSTSKRRVVDDFRLVENVKKKSFDMRIDIRPDGITELSVSAEDCPGLFSRIVGFLSSKGLNIVEGRLFTGKNGIVIDKISVSNWKEIWWDGLAGDLEDGLRKIIVHDKPVNVVRREKRAEVPFGVFIELDNEASDEFSLLEVFSPDRMGLLYDISHVMFKTGINIVSARINTDRGLAHDVFYVQSGKLKLTGERTLEVLSEIWAILKK